MAVTGVLMGMYFSGIPWMQNFVAPAGNREFGALENLEHLIILAVVWVAVRGIYGKRSKREKVVFAGVAFGSFFLFLEELDYGIHYLELITGEAYQGKVRNLHNYILNPYGLDFDALLSPVVYFILGFFFCFLPLIGLQSLRSGLVRRFPETFVPRLLANPWFRYLTPEPHSMGTVAAMVLIAQVAFFLDKTGVPSNLSFHGNISEFGEVFVHYIFFLYVIEMVYKRKSPHSHSVESEAQNRQKLFTKRVS
ncbi:MAG: hypothetical protein NPINA01_31680 [Nitrospinaceae bacterium]|nr:MAG: hypothetical protein NPINA01_31680 [Nitrospinaceae bacterium]